MKFHVLLQDLLQQIRRSDDTNRRRREREQTVRDLMAEAQEELRARGRRRQGANAPTWAPDQLANAGEVRGRRTSNTSGGS